MPHSREPRLAPRIALGALVGVVCGVAAAFPWVAPEAPPPIPTHTVTVTVTPLPVAPAAVVASAPGFNLAAHSLADPNSLWVVINKRRPIDPPSFVPADLVGVSGVGAAGERLRRPAAAALATMARAAREDGAAFLVSTAYRSQSQQADLHATYVRTRGAAVAEQISARPGYSEHQLGLAVDVYDPAGCNVDECFARTVSGRWLADNASRFGFVIRYPAGAESVTGYQYEPWHLRFVGTELANDMALRGVATLEAQFSLPSAPDYP